MKRSYIVSITFNIYLLFFCTCTTDIKYKEIDTYLSDLYRESKFSGYVLIAESGKVKFSKGFGFKDENKQHPITDSTQFNMSSASKIFTGTAVTKMAQEGNVSLNDTIGKFIPYLKYGNMVTLHDLLTHSSGLSDFFTHPKFSYEGVTSCADLIKFIKDQELLFQPGDSVRYSTSGMILLGALIEKVSGLTFPEYMNKNFFVPLKMNNSSFTNYGFVQDKDNNTKNYSKGFIKDSTGLIIKRPKKPSDDLFVPLSAGGIWSSASDLMKFDKALYSGNILDNHHLKLLLEPKVFTGWPDCYFGYAWINKNQNKSTHAVGHGGNASGHHITFHRYDIHQTTVILLTNYGFVNIFDIANEIEKLLFKEYTIKN